MGLVTWQTSNRLDIGNRLWYTPGRPYVHHEKLVAAMISETKRSAGQFKPDMVTFLLVLFALGLGFFVWNAHQELALNDIGWLSGAAQHLSPS